MHRHKNVEELVFDVHLNTFAEAVLAASESRPVLVDFWADWCAPCHAIAPTLLRVIQEQAGRVVLAKLEVDEGENMKLAGHYQVRGFPTVILFINGEERARFSSAKPRQFIERFLDEHLGTGNSVE